ncbi:MAG: hypothetical protein MK294_05510 [Rhodospirillales bacterium]|nr:hypothetical protein [Rhodospirillales bacterium]
MYFPASCLMTLTAEARDTVTRVGHPNLGIQFDFHNAQLMEGCLTRALEETIGSIKHMQIAGLPGRTPPDEGKMNYPYLFGAATAWATKLGSGTNTARTAPTTGRRKSPSVGPPNSASAEAGVT